jgi:hypothetical protein
MFFFLLACAVSRETLTTTEWGPNTQPHVHSISSLIRMLRMMLVQERNGSLWLLRGTPRAWLEQGKRIAIDRAPTWYGPVSLRAESEVERGAVRVRLDLPERIGAAPVRLLLRLPGGRRIGSVAAGGEPISGVDGEWIVLRGRAGRIDLTVTAAAGAGGATDPGWAVPAGG